MILWTSGSCHTIIQLYWKLIQTSSCRSLDSLTLPTFLKDWQSQGSLAALVWDLPLKLHNYTNIFFYHGKHRLFFVCKIIMSLSRLLSRTATLSRGAWSSRLLPARPLRAPYSAAAGLSRDIIQSRVLDVLKGFEKVDQAKVVSLSNPIFVSDLLIS